MLSGVLHHLPLRAGRIILGKTLVDGFAVGGAVRGRVPTETVKSAKFLHPGSSVEVVTKSFRPLPKVGKNHVFHFFHDKFFKVIVDLNCLSYTLHI